jgi:hypothetical protein
MHRPIKSMIRHGPMKILNLRKISDNHQFQYREAVNLVEITHSLTLMIIIRLIQLLLGVMCPR